MAALKKAQIHGCPIVSAWKPASTAPNPPFPERLADRSRPLKKSCNGTHTHSDGHQDLETELAQWADSVKKTN